MKYKVLSPIQAHGRRWEPGSGVELDPEIGGPLVKDGTLAEIPKPKKAEKDSEKQPPAGSGDDSGKSEGKETEKKPGASDKPPAKPVKKGK